MIQRAKPGAAPTSCHWHSDLLPLSPLFFCQTFLLTRAGGSVLGSTALNAPVNIVILEALVNEEVMEELVKEYAKFIREAIVSQSVESWCKPNKSNTKDKYK
ncbi:hypothetical protein M404DRAFT_30101 [Pisolithus tinctorius Marx 270]|uniref:Uncharacterized protein n=1 Tax=Pisolithus tinctorius Marx 270 TaxID=870435 RepID=A0A0C3JQT8_PISTI|nr:hypothetical protein M404DRAFT_30101 [Pisolithus tinctorius Marx 270]